MECQENRNLFWCGLWCHLLFFFLGLFGCVAGVLSEYDQYSDACIE
jgi:hypothetical protein